MATTKRERQKAARRLKMEAMQRQAKRRQNIRRGIIIAIVAVLIGGTGVLLFAGKSPTTTTTTTPTTTVATTTTTTVAKPVSFSPLADPSPAGTWGKAPTLVVPPGAPPAKAELANLITGTGTAVALGDKFTAQYVLADYSSRKVLQSSWTTSSFTDTLLPGNLISGWVYGMVGMKVGGRRELILPPVDAYGATPPSGIPTNDTLVFIIDLLKVTK